MMSASRSETILATLVISGTCIGAGMLALPTASAHFGFFPSMLVSLVCALTMMWTGLLLAEVTLQQENNDAHFSSLCRAYLGKAGQLVGNVLFLFLYYAILVSYYSGSLPYATALMQGILPEGLVAGAAYFLFGGGMLLLLLLGAGIIARVNSLLMGGLMITFCGVFFIGVQHMQSDLIATANWSGVWLASPFFFGAYGYQNVVPTVVRMLRRDARAIRRAICWGSILAFSIYGFWQLMVMGNIDSTLLSQGRNDAGVPVVEALRQHTGSSWLPSIIMAFSFFALTTSLIGVSFSMVDFLKDLRSERISHVAACLMAIVPPILISIFYPGLFIKAFGLASGYGEACINALFPIMMMVSLYRIRPRFHGQLLRRAGLTPKMLVLVLVTLAVIASEVSSSFQ